MKNRKSNTPAIPEKDVATIFVAIELSKASWVIAVHTPLCDKISLFKHGISLGPCHPRF